MVVCDLPIKNYWMIVYDRWGETVFETFEYSDVWDGKINGVDVEEGVYIYYIELSLSGGELVKFSGDLTLIR